MRTVARSLPVRAPRRAALGLLLALVATLLLFVAATAAAGPGDATPADQGRSGLSAVPAVKADGGTVFQFGKDAVIGPDETADAVVSLGGDVTVDGTVKVAVAVGGDVEVNGNVRETVVAVGGDVRLRPTAVVGLEGKDEDAAIVLVGGQLQRDDGSRLLGGTTTVRGEWVTSAFRAGFWDPVVNSLGAGSLFWSLGWTIVWIVLAVILVAIAPRQVRAVADTLLARPLAALGWGALTGIIILPVSIVLVAITIVGLLIAVPAVAVGLPLLYVFVNVCLAAFIGTQILRGSAKKRGSLMPAAVLGIVIVNVVRLIPFVGGVVLFFAGLMAFGALVLAVADWRQRRREARRSAAAGPEPPAPGAPTDGGGPYGVPPAAPPGVTAPPAPGTDAPAAGAQASAPGAVHDDTTDIFTAGQEVAGTEPVPPAAARFDDSDVTPAAFEEAAAPDAGASAEAPAGRTPPPAVGTGPPPAPEAPGAPDPEAVAPAAPDQPGGGAAPDDDASSDETERRV